MKTTNLIQKQADISRYDFSSFINLITDHIDPGMLATEMDEISAMIGALAAYAQDVEGCIISKDDLRNGYYTLKQLKEVFEDMQYCRTSCDDDNRFDVYLRPYSEKRHQDIKRIETDNRLKLIADIVQYTAQNAVK